MKETPNPPGTSSAPADPSSDDRTRARHRWLADALATRAEVLREAPAPMQADASFRRFERLTTDAGPRVLMDAPPERENNEAFVRVCAWLEAAGLDAPRVLAHEASRGFLLVTEVGETTLSRALESADPGRRAALYLDAIDALVAFQRATLETPPPFPAYDAERLALENGLFGTWCVEGLLGLKVPDPLLRDTLASLTQAHLAAPRIGVHLDWHSRNLLPRPGGGMAMVDVQDARIGPLPYDLVSLLRDCYQRLAPAEIEAGISHYLLRAADAGIPGTGDSADFRRSFDLIGMQRHLKAAGIFARLSLRDGRHHALGDLPHTLAMVRDVGREHATTRALADWLDGEVLPALAARLRAPPVDDA